MGVRSIEPAVPETPSPLQAESLEQAWVAALAADHRLKAAGKTTESAQQTLSAAKAAWLPQLSVEGGYAVVENAPAAVLSLPGLALGTLPLTDDTNFTAFGSSLLQPIFTSGRISHSVDAADAALRAAQADESRQRADLKMSLSETYVTVLRAQSGAEVAASLLVSLSAHAQDVADLFEHGLVAKNDLLAAQVALADARQERIRVSNALEIARATYNRLLGRDLANAVYLAELSSDPIAGSLEALTWRALKQRPELDSLAEQSEALRHQAASQRASILPQVAAAGGYSFVQNRLLTNQGVWWAGVGVKWEVFKGGSVRFRTHALRKKSEALLDLRNDLESAIALQVRKAWLDVTETRKRIEATREAVAQAEENLQVARDRYAAGIGTNTEVLDAEALRTLTRSNHANAGYDAVLATLRLRHAVGEL